MPDPTDPTPSTTLYIREGRFGPPKCYKTGSVVETYPAPMLVINYDRGGLEILKRRKPVYFSPTDLSRSLADPTFSWPEVSCLDLSFHPHEGAMTNDFLPIKEDTTLQKSVAIVNCLHRVANERKGILPFKTIVIDPVTRMSDMVVRAISKNNEGWMADARKWAGNASNKVKDFVDCFTALPCNVVFIFHSELEKNEIDGGKVRIIPRVFGALKDALPGMFSQYFYQENIGGVGKVRVSQVPLVEGIGARWPDLSAQTVYDPDFNSLYGRDPRTYK